MFFLISWSSSNKQLIRLITVAFALSSCIPFVGYADGGSGVEEN